MLTYVMFLLCRRRFVLLVSWCRCRCAGVFAHSKFQKISKNELDLRQMHARQSRPCKQMQCVLWSTKETKKKREYVGVYTLYVLKWYLTKRLRDLLVDETKERKSERVRKDHERTQEETNKKTREIVQCNQSVEGGKDCKWIFWGNFQSFKESYW